MKNQNLIVLGLAAIAVYMIMRAKNPATSKPSIRTAPSLDQWATGPNGEGLF